MKFREIGSVMLVSGTFVSIFFYSLLFQRGIAAPFSVATLYFLLKERSEYAKNPKEFLFLLFFPLGFLILELLDIKTTYILVIVLIVIIVLIFLGLYKKTYKNQRTKAKK